MRAYDPRIPGAALLLVALPLGGCGGGEEPAPAPPVPPAQPAAAGSGGSLPDVRFFAVIADEATGSEPDATEAEDEGPDLDELRAAVRAAPDDLDALRRLGRALIDSGLFQEALPHFERAARLEPGPRGQLELGIAYAGVSRLPEAETAYNKVLELAPDHPAALLNLGNLAVKRGDHATAIEWYGRAIQSDPRYMMAYLHLASAFRALGATERAYAVYLTILDEMRPSTPLEQGIYNEAVYELASLALSLGQPAQAENLLVHLVRVSPGHAGAHYVRGQALLQLGRQEEAEREFQIHMDLLSRRKPMAATASAPDPQ